MSAGWFTAQAQQSGSFKLKESGLNSGGSPAGGSASSSASFRISHDAIGGSIGYRSLSAPSFRMDPNFVAAYRPAGEVLGLLFTDAQTLAWNAEQAAVGYSVYRDLLPNLSGLGYGSCLATDIATNTTTDAAIPPLSNGYFYLVAARNRLDEEGAIGFDSTTAERPNPTPCP
jgi:hypothetical protein